MLMQLHARAAARRGAMLPLVAMLLPVMLILASFVVNIAYMELTRTELRIASDSATRAAGYALKTTGDLNAARAAAREGARRNPVAGTPTQLADGDIVFGTSQRNSLAQRYQFTASNTRVNSVFVDARRNAGSLTGAVSAVMPTFGAVSEFGPNQSAISTQVELDVALVLDRSGSMAYAANENSESKSRSGAPPAMAPPGWSSCDPAPPGSRWLDLVSAVQVFEAILARSAQEENVSLATYSSRSSLEASLGSDFDLVTGAMDDISQRFCGGSTNIGAGLTEGLNAVTDPRRSRPWAVKVIILLTDGRHNTGQDPSAAALRAAELGVTIYTVTFSDEADQSRMRQVAEIGGGRHIHAASAEELENAFREIGRRLPTLLTQ